MIRVPFTALSRFEKISDISLSAINTAFNLQSQGGNLPMDRFIESLRLELKGRITIPAAGGGGVIPSAVNADAPWSAIDRITVTGMHKVRGTNEEIINLRGPDIAQLCRIYTSHAMLATPTIVVTASATMDVIMVFDSPFTPLKMPPWIRANYLLDAPNYDNLKLTVYWADMANLYTLGTGTPTWTAYASATGTPTLTVSGRFSQAGASAFRGIVPGRVFRYFTDKTGTDMTAGGTSKRIADIPRGNRMRSILVKTGVKATTTGQNNAYLTLSNDILTNIRVMRGLNKQVRYYPDFYNLAEESGVDYAIRPDAGYGLMDFAQNGLVDEALDLRGLIVGSTGDVDTYLEAQVTGAAGQAATVIWEELRYEPMDLSGAQSVARR